MKTIDCGSAAESLVLRSLERITALPRDQGSRDRSEAGAEKLHQFPVRNRAQHQEVLHQPSEPHPRQVQYITQ